MSAIAFEKIANLLLQFSEVERNVEVTRQVLVENVDFDPCHAFWRLDRRAVDQISKEDIRVFLEENDVFLSRSEMNGLFDHLDRNKDGVIDWDEFIKTVISREGSFYEVGRSSYTLPLEVEHSLVRVFQEELEGLRRLEDLKQQIFEYGPEELASAFYELDRTNKGWVSQRDLYIFLDNYVGPVTNSIVERTLRRLDTDCDGRVSFREWREGMTPYDIDSTVVVRREVRSGGETIVETRSPGKTVVERSSPTYGRRTVIERSSPSYVRRTVIEGGEEERRSIKRDSPFKTEVVTTYSPNRTKIERRSPQRSTNVVDRVFSETQSVRRSSPLRTRTIERTSPVRETVIERRSPGETVIERRSPGRTIVERRTPGRTVVETRSPTRHTVTQRRSEARETVLERRSPGHTMIETRSPGKTIIETRSPERSRRTIIDRSSPIRTVIETTTTSQNQDKTTFQPPREVEERRTEVRLSPSRSYITREIIGRNNEDSAYEAAQRKRFRTTERLQTEERRNFVRTPGKSNPRWTDTESRLTVNYASPSRAQHQDGDKSSAQDNEDNITESFTNDQVRQQKPESFTDEVIREVDGFQPSTSQKLEDSNNEYEDEVFKQSLKSKQEEFSTSTQIRSSLTIEERHNLVESLKEFFRDHRELEEKKINLSLRFDVTIDELFNLADFSSSRLVSPEDLHMLLQAAKCGTIYDDAYFLIARYDRDGDGYLNFSEFQEMIAPFSREYRKAMQARTPRRIQAFREFTLQTQRTFKDLIVSIIEAEQNQDYHREKVRHRIFTLFNIIDKNGKGQITLDDLGDALSEYGLTCTHRELCAVIKKFDLDLDGKISYDEFVEQLSPKKFSTPLKSRL